MGAFSGTQIFFCCSKPRPTLRENLTEREQPLLVLEIGYLVQSINLTDVCLLYRLQAYNNAAR
jgi:hypothetical protein